MDITIQGLTPKQKTFCDIIWNLDSKEKVNSFVKTLPKNDQKECWLMIEMMTLAFIDQIDQVDDAVDIIENIRKK